MKTIISIIKINILSLTTILLFSVSIICKVFKTIFKNLWIIIIISLLTSILIGVYEIIVHWNEIMILLFETSNPSFSDFEDDIRTLIWLFLLGWGSLITIPILILIIAIVITLTTGLRVFALLGNFSIQIGKLFEKIYGLSFDKSLYLINECKHSFLKLNMYTMCKNLLCCAFYVLLFVFYKIISFIMFHAKKFSFVLILGSIFISIVILNNYTTLQFHLNLIEKFKVMSIISLIFNLSIYAACMTAIIILIISLAYEFKDWWYGITVKHFQFKLIPDPIDFVQADGPTKQVQNISGLSFEEAQMILMEAEKQGIPVAIEEVKNTDK